MTDWQVQENAWAELVTMQLRRINDDLNDLREVLAELDHAKVPRRAFEELHNRVDAIERMSR